MTEHRRNPAGARYVTPHVDRTRAVAVAFALALVATVAVVAVRGIDTALARFSATTTNEGSWLAAGEIAISTGPAALAIDVDNLAPGRVVERCIRTTYQGSIDDVSFRAYGRTDGGSGLERHLDTVVERGGGVDSECADFEPAGELFAGSLADLHAAHDSWSSALPIAESMSDGDALTIRISIEVRADDRAQGLDTGFWLILEARA